MINLIEELLKNIEKAKIKIYKYSNKKQVSLKEFILLKKQY